MICIHGDFLPLTLSNHLTKPLRTAWKGLLSWCQTHPNNPQVQDVPPRIFVPRLRHRWNCDILPMMTTNATPYRRGSMVVKRYVDITWGFFKDQVRWYYHPWKLFNKNGRKLYQDFWSLSPRFAAKVLWCILTEMWTFPPRIPVIRSLTFLPNLHFPLLRSNSHSIFPWFIHYNPCIWYIYQHLP